MHTFGYLRFTRLFEAKLGVGDYMMDVGCNSKGTEFVLFVFSRSPLP